MKQSITIHGHAFPLLVDGDGVEHVKLVSLSEPFGLDVDSQRKRLNATAWATPVKITSRRSDGKKTGFLCIPLEQVPMYFATLSPGHVNDEFRPALIAMQKDVAKAVGDYYLRGGAIRPGALPDQLRDLSAKIDEILRKEPLTDAVWPVAFVRRYEAWHGRTWKEGNPQPFSMKAANWFFYRMIFPREVLVVVRDRGLFEGCRYHQVLADAPRDYLQRELRIATVLAEECGSEVEWRQRMRRAYGKTKAQMNGQESLSL